MRIRFDDKKLEELVTIPNVKTRLDHSLVRAYRKRIQLIRAMRDETDLYGFPGLKPHRLAGKRKGQSAVRINDQYRLLYKLERDEAGTVFVVREITDYH